MLHGNRIFVQVVDLRTSLYQQLGDLRSAPLHGTEERRLVVDIDRVDRMANVEQVGREPRVPVEGRLVQRCSTLVIRLARRGLPLHQQANDVLVILPSCLPHCCAEVGLLAVVEVGLHGHNGVHFVLQVPQGILHLVSASPQDGALSQGALGSALQCGSAQRHRSGRGRAAGGRTPPGGHRSLRRGRRTVAAGGRLPWSASGLGSIFVPRPS
mmetsp:Transcript_87414/g.252071  ORF Transcript_87414/g.252071 Transcript_87414/m.252071 type:complete len:212 (-) Transcript_87414:237-872(-)